MRRGGPLYRAIQAQGVDDCIEWSGCRMPSGYGQAGNGRGGVTTAHRRVWEWLNGPIVAEHLDHLCRNRACVNVTHLEPVSAALNNERARDFVQALPASTHCRNGHEWTPENVKPTKTGHRKCRTCENAYLRRLRAGRKRLLADLASAS